MVRRDPDIPAYIKDALDGITVIACDNVSQYFFEETDQEDFSLKDFPNIAPPFDAFWLDIKAPSKVVSEKHGVIPWQPPAPEYWGFQCFTGDMTNEDDRQAFFESCGNTPMGGYFKTVIDRAKWGIDMYLYVYQQGQITPLAWAWRFLVDDQGAVIRRPGDNSDIVATMTINDDISALIQERAKKTDYEQARMSVYSHFLPYWHVALLSISFMHCKNVELNPVNPPVKNVHNKAQKRRGVQPYKPIPYKVLDIRPMQQVLRHEGRSGQVGTKKALHICRGHFADYTAGAGLFGKHKGVFWIPQHVKGSSGQGITTKDYRIAKGFKHDQ